MQLKANYKIWLEYNKKPLLGKGRYNLLKTINKTNSLKRSVDILKINYKTAFNHIRKIEERLGKRIIDTHKGGKDAGGYTRLTPLGKELVTRYEEIISRIR